MKTSVFRRPRKKVYIAMSYDYSATDFVAAYASVERAHADYPDVEWGQPDKWGVRYSPRWKLHLLEADLL